MKKFGPHKDECPTLVRLNTRNKKGAIFSAHQSNNEIVGTWVCILFLVIKPKYWAQIDIFLVK